MIHEIYPHQFDNRFQNNLMINENDLVFHFKDNSLLLNTSGEDLQIPLRKELEGENKTDSNIFLFKYDNLNCFLIFNEEKDLASDQLAYKEINFFRTIKIKELGWISLVAYQLRNWHIANKFCGKCGSATEQKDNERAIVCPHCQTTYYPKISPAIIVAIRSNNKILLAHNVNFPVKWYSLVAGYADIGESLEEAVIREVKEEVGLDVSNIRYYKSQPWPLSGSMMIGYIADADENQPIKVDNLEIDDAAWFTKDNLPNHPSNYSIAGEIVEKFKNSEL